MKGNSLKFAVKRISRKVGLCNGAAGDGQPPGRRSCVFEIVVVVVVVACTMGSGGSVQRLPPWQDQSDGSMEDVFAKSAKRVVEPRVAAYRCVST